MATLDDLAMQADSQVMLPEDAPGGTYDQIAQQPQQMQQAPIQVIQASPQRSQRVQKPRAYLSAFTNQQEYDALPDWQKEAVRKIRSGVQMTPEDLGEFAMKYQKPVSGETVVVADPVTGDKGTYVRTSEGQLSPFKGDTEKRPALRPDAIFKLTEFKNLSDLAQVASDKIEKLPDSQLGPVDSRAKDLSQWALGVDPKYQEAMQSYNAVRNQILKLRSGGAVTDGEAERLLSELGTPTQSDGVFKLNLKGFAAQQRNNTDNQIANLKDSGYDLPENLLKGTKSDAAQKATTIYPVPIPSAIERLKANPGTEDQFDAIFGPGSAKAALGK